MLHALNKRHQRAPEIGAPTAQQFNRQWLVARVPRFPGPAGASHRGHETKKDISMLMRLSKGYYLALSKGHE